MMLQTQQLLQHTKLFRYGRPFRTGAVILDIPENAFRDETEITYVEFERRDGKCLLRYHLHKVDRVYGLGEQLGGLNKRGRLYKTFNTDIAPHHPNLETLYGSHPFLIVDGPQGFGLFIDYPSEMTFDIGQTHKDVMEILIPSEHVDLYLFNVNSSKEIVKEYLTLTGSPYVPPKWAFGYQQCRYSYPDAKTVSEIAGKFRSLDIPCDAIGMDIDYMADYKVFTLDEEKFPNFPNFVHRMKEEGFRLIPIIDAAVKVEKGYSVYDEGKTKGYFCVDKDGKDFVAAVWPGLCHFPDFQRPEVRTWWGQLYKRFTDVGIEGFWNDMNEPAIFYVPEVLRDIRERMYRILGKENIGRELEVVSEDLTSIFNRRDYYDKFYQQGEDGQRVNHEEIHNLYAFNMTRGTAEQLEQAMPEKRYFLLSRGSYAGQHRFGGIWTGDNSSWWEHLLMNIKMLISLNLTGFFYNGADIGGFDSDPSPELMIRWMQLGVFSPLFRNHSWFGVRNQEPWSFDDESTTILRNMLRLRYALVPYAYSEFMRAARELKPFIAPLFMEFNGERVREVEDQYLYGDSLMVAPVYTPNAKGRFVHLPECRWLYWKAAQYEQREMQVMEAGDYYVQADLHETPIFLRENRLIVLSEPGKHVDEKIVETLHVVGLVTDSAEFCCYEDDGQSYDYRQGKYANSAIRVRKDDESYHISCEKDERNGFRSQLKEIHCEIYNTRGKVFTRSLRI